MLFYLKFAWFHFKEPFSDVTSGIFSLLTFPFYVWIIGKLWGRYSAVQSHLSLEQVLTYAAVTELLFLTFLRFQIFSRASRDFSLSLAMPRNWAVQHFFGFFGRCLGNRLLLMGFLLVSLPLIGVPTSILPDVLLRIMSLIPVLTVLQSLYALCFAVAHIRFEQTTYFVLPFTKVFLVLGGVFGPLCDITQKWQTPLLALWPSDLFFQPAYYAVTGAFYQLSTSEWLLRISFQAMIVCVGMLLFYRHARTHHQSWGG